MKNLSEIKEETIFLNQLIKTLEESESKLEGYYEKGDHKNFENLRKFMLTILEKISEVIK